MTVFITLKDIIKCGKSNVLHFTNGFGNPSMIIIIRRQIGTVLVDTPDGS